MAQHPYFPLITAQQVKDTLPEINDNIPDELLTDNIKISQQMKIRPILGYDWYIELEQEMSAGSLKSTNQYILDEYLDMILSLYVQKRLVMTQSYQLENNGLRTKISDISQLSDTTDITYYRSDLQNDIDFLVNEMIKYIDAYPSDFPLYINRTDPRGNTDDEGRRRYNYGFNISSVQNDCNKLR